MRGRLASCAVSRLSKLVRLRRGKCDDADLVLISVCRSGWESLAGYRQTAYTRRPHAAMKTSLAFGPSIANQNKNIRIE